MFVIVVRLDMESIKMTHIPLISEMDDPWLETVVTYLVSLSALGWKWEILTRSGQEYLIFFDDAYLNVR